MMATTHGRPGTRSSAACCAAWSASTAAAPGRARRRAGWRAAPAERQRRDRARDHDPRPPRRAPPGAIVRRRASSEGQASTSTAMSATRPASDNATSPQSDRLAASTATAPQPEGRMRTTAASAGERPSVSRAATSGTRLDATASSVMTSASSIAAKSRPRRELITGPNRAIATWRGDDGEHQVEQHRGGPGQRGRRARLGAERDQGGERDQAERQRHVGEGGAEHGVARACGRGIGSSLK